MKTSCQLRSESGDGSSVDRALWVRHHSSTKLCEAPCHSRTDHPTLCHLILVPICSFIRETTFGRHFPDLVPMWLGRLAPHKEESYRFKKEIKKPLLPPPPCILISRNQSSFGSLSSIWQGWRTETFNSPSSDCTCSSSPGCFPFASFTRHQCWQVVPLK